MHAGCCYHDDPDHILVGEGLCLVPVVNPKNACNRNSGPVVQQVPDGDAMIRQLRNEFPQTVVGIAGALLLSGS